MVVTCEIQFENNPEGCYFAGQVMTGKIVLSADKAKQVKAVTMKINGFAHTHWTEKDRDKNESFHGHIDYIDSLSYLMSPSASDQAVTIEPGIHSFNFSCHIPTNCPSSFEGYKGHIRYIIQVNLVRPWKFDQTFSRGFTVLKVMDLNYDTPLLKMPVNNTMSKVFCCGPFKTDPFQMQIQMPQSAYVPGQLIPVSILVSNDTKVEVNEICVRLMMLVCIYSQRPRVKAVNEYSLVSKLKGDPVPVLCKKQFNYLLPVPATPPTCFNLCSIIQIAYRIEVEAKMKGMFYANQVAHVPVTIGNVPLVSTIQQQPIMKHDRMLNSQGGDETDGQTEHPWAINDSIPYPVFEQTSFMPQAQIADAANHDYGEKSFSPKYPVFNIPSPTIEDNTVPPIVTDTNKSTWL